MHFSTSSFRLRPQQILFSVGVMVLLYGLVGGFFYTLAVICHDDSFGSYLQESWGLVACFPVTSAFFHAFASRKHRLQVHGVSKAQVAAEWAVRFLGNEGLQMQEMKSGRFVLESKKKRNRAFNHWLGSELVFIDYAAGEVTVTGHQRFIDALDARLRFGKVAFK